LAPRQRLRVAALTFVRWPQPTRDRSDRSLPRSSTCSRPGQQRQVISSIPAGASRSRWR
jgi:hypothetical protein